MEPRRQLVKNSLRCKKCNTVLHSVHRHDFNGCKCGVFIDGGLDYQRAGWPSGSPDEWIEDLSEYAPAVEEKK